MLIITLTILTNVNQIVNQIFKAMSNKINLPNGCAMTQPSVHPSDWKTGGASLLKKYWRIQYYFYPANGKRKLVVVKGMNHLNNLPNKRFVTKGLIEDIVETNKSGYNPILRKMINSVNQNAELHPYLFFIDAFRIAATKIQCTEKHKKETEICIKRLESNVGKLKMRSVVIEQLTRRQLKLLMESCNFPNSYFNKCLSILSRIFGELIEYECCEVNIVRDIRTRKIVRKQREILLPERHEAVMDYLHKNYYEFWRYARIFYLSGARSTELFQVQVKDIDIKNQEYRTTILKGSNPHEVTKVILSEVLPLWEQMIQGAKQDDYLFSKGLKAGSEKIKSYQITKRWYRLVKQSDKIKDNSGKTIKITADFYSLKHSFLDSLPEDKAMLIASHTNSKTTSIYRVNKEKNEREQLKSMKL